MQNAESESPPQYCLKRGEAKERTSPKEKGDQSGTGEPEGRQLGSNYNDSLLLLLRRSGVDGARGAGGGGSG